MGLFVICNHLNTIGGEFNLNQEGLNLFVHPGHKGLSSVK